MKRYLNKTIVVTGASRGIGQSILLAFAREGAHVVGISSGDQSATAALVEELGAGFTAITADLKSLDQQAARAVVDQIIAAAGRLDGWINNAGIIRRHPAVVFPETDWHEVMQVNLHAPFFFCQAAARWWINSGRDSAGLSQRFKIINIASMLSFQGGILVPAYTASKSAIAGVTKALACEWAKERINVNAVAPGYIATENTRPLREDSVRNEAILARIPEGRWGEAEDIAGSCLYLASADADYVNGAILNVDGGWLSR